MKCMSMLLSMLRYTVNLHMLTNQMLTNQMSTNWAVE